MSDLHCRSLSPIIRKLGHEGIDLIKLNIEWSEHIVLDVMLAAEARRAVVSLTSEGSSAFCRALSRTRGPCGAIHRRRARRARFSTYDRNASRPALSSVA